MKVQMIELKGSEINGLLEMLETAMGEDLILEKAIGYAQALLNSAFEKEVKDKDGNPKSVEDKLWDISTYLAHNLHCPEENSRIKRNGSFILIQALFEARMQVDKVKDQLEKDIKDIKDINERRSEAKLANELKQE